MWIPRKLLDLLSVNRDIVQGLREESATLRASNLLLERELTSTKVNLDWARMRVNQLEAERVKLLQQAYPGLQLPAPEIARVNHIKDGFDLQALFTDPEEAGLKPVS